MKFFQDNKDISLVFFFMFLLLLLEQGYFFEKFGSKYYYIFAFSYNSAKIVFIWQKKVIIPIVVFILIFVKSSSFL